MVSDNQKIKQPSIVHSRTTIVSEAYRPTKIYLYVQRYPLKRIVHLFFFNYYLPFTVPSSSYKFFQAHDVAFTKRRKLRSILSLNISSNSFRESFLQNEIKRDIYTNVFISATRIEDLWEKVRRRTRGYGESSFLLKQCLWIVMGFAISERMVFRFDEKEQIVDSLGSSRTDRAWRSFLFEDRTTTKNIGKFERK